MKTNEKEIEWAMEHCQSFNKYPDVFPEDYGMDFHLDSNPELYTKKLMYGSDKRRCIIEITSFAGICFGAVHYYAKIKADGVHICRDDVDKDGNKTTVYIGGYICKEFKELPRDKQAEYSSFYDIEITRPVTQDDIDSDKIRWEGYEVGYKTNAFYTKEDAIETAKRVAKARFPKGWIIKVNDET